jgi:hypothetical protein
MTPTGALTTLINGFLFGVGFFLADLLMVTLTHHRLCG